MHHDHLYPGPEDALCYACNANSSFIIGESCNLTYFYNSSGLLLKCIFAIQVNCQLKLTSKKSTSIDQKTQNWVNCNWHLLVLKANQLCQIVTLQLQSRFSSIRHPFGASEVQLHFYTGYGKPLNNPPPPISPEIFSLNLHLSHEQPGRHGLPRISANLRKSHMPDVKAIEWH